ncbi:MAG: S9 family peptidase [Candidatus Marinimicrobia bacterium]|nr:S9 family peptidase [Candidatus Neomarinimicrobiota bacterium]
MHYTLWYPETHLTSEKFPLILFLNEAKKPVSDLYEWEFSNLIAQWISSKGYIVAEIDYPTLPEIPEKIDADRGLEPPEMQLQDIDAVIGALTKEEFIDVSRIGTWGFGYGGYLSLMALLREPDRFGVVIPSEINWERSYSIYDRNIFRKIAASDYTLSLNLPDISSNPRGKLLEYFDRYL